MALLMRQVMFRLARGQKSALADALAFPWRFRDVEPRNKLVLGDGKHAGGYFSLAASGTFTIPLPSDYSSADNISFMLTVNRNMELTLVSPVHGSGTFLLKGTNGVTDGDHPALFAYQGRVTSVALTNPSGTDAALVEYFCYEMPDLALPASWKDGAQTIGTV